MHSNVANVNNHKEKRQDMLSPIQMRAKVFSNLKKLQISKAAKLALPWPKQNVWEYAACKLASMRVSEKCFFALCILRVCVYLHELCPIWEVVKVVCYLWKTGVKWVCVGDCVVSKQQQDGRAYSLYKDTVETAAHCNCVFVSHNPRYKMPRNAPHNVQGNIQDSVLHLDLNQ